MKLSNFFQQAALETQLSRTIRGAGRLNEAAGSISCSSKTHLPSAWHAHKRNANSLALMIRSAGQARISCSLDAGLLLFHRVGLLY